MMMFFVPAADARNEGDRFRFLTVGRTLECAPVGPVVERILSNVSDDFS